MKSRARVLRIIIYPFATEFGINRREEYDDGTFSTLEIWNGRPRCWYHGGDPEKIIARISRR